MSDNIHGKRIGDMNRVANDKRTFGSATSYLHVRVQRSSGKEQHLLFTDNEIAVAKERAERNPEDLIEPSFIQDLLD